MTDWGPPSGKLRPSQWQKPNDRNGTMTEMIGIMELKPGDLVLVKADAFKGKRKIKDRWEDETCEVVYWITWQMSPSTKWWTNAGSHTSSTAANFFSSHQRLVFPCVWVSTKDGTNVPPPLQLSQLSRVVIVRIHHKWIVVWQSPNAPDQQDLPGVDQHGKLWLLPWTSTRSIHRGWVNTSGNV